MPNATFYPDEESCLSEYGPALLQSNFSYPTLTHIDPTFYNIVVRSVEGKERNWEVTVIDLEHFGWLPAWAQPLACLERRWIGISQEAYMDKITQKFGASYEDEINLHERLHEWASYPV
jgi:hypothetical protein